MDSLEDLEIGPSSFVSLKEGKGTKYYKLERELVDMKYAKVYQVTHKTTKLPRILKCINKRGVIKDKGEDLFLEANILKSLDHPNIVKLFEVFQDEKTYMLVTEFCSGLDLFTSIAMESHYTEKEAAHHMRQIISAIAYLHQKDIVYTNLNADNLIFATADKDAPLKLIGFGFARRENGPEIPEKMDHKRDIFHSAPEVLQGKSEKKSDIWSCGILMCEILTGMPPFFGENDEKIREVITKGQLEFQDDVWKNLSSDALDLVKKMLVLDPKDRISASDALAHLWFAKNWNNPINLDSIKNLASFHSRNKLKRAILSLIATQTMTEEDLAELKETFAALDKDGNGVLSSEELIEGYKSYFKNNANAEQEALKILEEVDFDHSGLIEFTEFIVAASDHKKLLTKERMEKAFRIFDINGDGYITRSELSSVLGGLKLSDAQWSQLVGEADQNDDGIVIMREFL